MNKILNDDMKTIFFEMLDPDPSRGYEKPKFRKKNIAQRGARTHDRWIKSPTLYRLS